MEIPLFRVHTLNRMPTMSAMMTSPATPLTTGIHHGNFCWLCGGGI